ncbi:MAG: hypothetical protein ACJ754_19470 [Pyrinomonadaceae bacterium]
MKASPQPVELTSPATPRAEFAAGRARTARLAVTELIDLLASEELRTRFIAEMCLRDATGT